MNNTLYHHGILGQKWGVRRFQNADGSLTSAGKKRRHEEPNNKEKTNKETRVKNKQEMSNAELQEKINRMQLERQYNQLYRELHPQQVSMGKKFADKMKDETVNVAVQSISKVTRKIIDNAIDKKFGENTSKITKTIVSDVKKVSDKDLKKIMERVDLESRYNNAHKNKNTKTSTDNLDFSKMTDKELQDTVARLALEEKVQKFKK